MNKAFHLILFSFIITETYCQENYLNTCFDFGSQIEQINEYNNDLESVINSKLNPNYIIRYIAKPSFSPEYLFQIEKQNNTYTLKTIIFKENLWYCTNRDFIKLDYWEEKIDYVTAIKLDRLFTKVTTSAESRQESSISGIDGVTYMFYKQLNTEENYCGECWSPSKNTPLYDLVAICNSIIEMSKNNDSNYIELDNQIDVLYDKIE